MALLLAVISTFACSGHARESRSSPSDNIAPCPDSPNCVSSKSIDMGHTMSPLPYLKSGQESMDRLVGIVGKMKRVTIVSATPTYFHVEFRSALLGFIDDVEFILDDSVSLIHFRSASKTGYYDFGVNRRRMLEISNRYLGLAEKEN